MQSSHHLKLAVLLLSMTAAVPTQAAVQLLSLTAAWRYQETTNFDGVNWSSSAYNDSDWPTGNALLYVENNPLVYPRNTLLTLGRTTYYFRTHFNVPFATTNAIVSFSSQIDDGAVFYLNGVEIQRVRLPAAPTPVTYATLATGTPAGGDATTSETFTLSDAGLTNFVPGDNVLAVEVHQDATNGDDIVFGASVTWKFTNSPPVIVSQPTNVFVVDGRPATLTAIVDGDPAPTLQWYKEGVAIPDATNSWLYFAAAYPSNSGTYWLTATNILGGLTSSNAAVTVLDDTNSPVIVSALAQKNLTNIAVSFSEPILSSTAIVPNNYEIFQTILPSNHLDVLSVALSGNAGVVLTTTMRTPGLNYSIRVNGIRDISSASNSIAPNSEMPLTYQVDLVAVDALTTWRYFQQGAEPATNWMVPTFDDSNWPQGAAVFAGGSPPPLTSDPVRTALSLAEGTNAVITYYFRTFFDLSGSVIPNSLRMHDIADDGAIFYLNGQEVFSVGMPPGRPVTYATSASRTVSTATYEPPPSLAGWSLSDSNLTALGNGFAAELHQRTDSMADAAFAVNLEAVITRYNPRLQLFVPPTVQEGVGTLTNQAWVSILEPLETNLVIEMTSTSPAEVSVPSQVVIPAGNTNASFSLAVGDDVLVNGPRTVTVSAESLGLTTATAGMLVLDNETNTIQVRIAPTTSETNGSLPGEIDFGQPAAVPITVSLASSDSTALTVPASLVIPAGATSAVFQATVVDDLLLDGPQIVTLSAAVAGWPTASTTVVVTDNESTMIDLVTPATVLEGSGILVNAGQVSLGGLAVSNLTIQLISSDPASLVVPTNVTVLAGQSNAFFNLLVPDNFIVESNRLVDIAASAPGLISVSNFVTVVDNDPDHIRFGPVGWVQDTNTFFGLMLRAEHADGSLQTNFNLSLNIVAEGLEGALPLEPTNTTPFVQGQKYLSFRVLAPGHAVRLRALNYPGQSDPFNVGLPPFMVATQKVVDIAWNEPSETFFATVPADGGIYANRLVAIDPATGNVTNSYPIGDDPGQIEIAPGGDWLYVAISNATALQRFDIVTRQAGLRFALGTNTEPVRFAYDYCVPSGLADSVVVETRDRDSLGSTHPAGLKRYDSGVPVSLPNFDASGGWNLESMPSGSLVLLSSPLAKGNAATGAILVTSPSSAGTVVTYRDGVIYDNAGSFFSASSLALLGSYPGVLDQFYYNALPEVNASARRVFYLAGNFNYGSSFYKLKVYDRDLLQQLLQLPVPSSRGAPTRFIRWGSNGLAYATGNGELWFIRPDLIQPDRTPADVQLSLRTSTSLAVVGSNYTFTLSLSNAGPGMASVVRVTNSLPANVTILDTVPSTGSVVTTNSAFTWNVPAFPAGSNATLDVTVRFGNAGWQTNLAYALGFEADPVFTNNRLQFPIYVQLPADGAGAFLLLAASEDLLYDPVRDRLLLSVGSGSAGQNNGLAVLNPYNGLVESFTSLGKKPARLARSDDGQQLYVSLPDDARVRRLTLTNLQQNLEFSLGGEYLYGVWYPFYAADMAVVPGNSASLAAWRVRRPGPMAGEYGWGIAMFDDGIMRSNVTASGGSWKVEFDTDTGTLYGFNSGDLRRCSLDSNGVSFVEAYPQFYSAGDDLEYAAGQFYTTAGRLVQTQPFQIKWAFAGAESATLVEPDAASDRVFFLVQQSGWQIKAYDMQTYRPLGSIVISNLVGTPTSLIRWGTNGLAFRTTSNQLFLIRAPLIQPSAAADLAVGIDGPDGPVAAGSEALFILSLTNRGPTSAQNVVLTNWFTPGAEITWTFCTDGSCLTTNGQVLWNLPSLDSGQDSFAAVVVRPMQTGAVSVVASVTSATPDPQTGDNAAMRALQVGAPPDLDGVTRLQISANDLAWSPSLGRLLLTATANMPNWAGGLLSLDPLTLKVRFEATLGNDAGRLAVSRDDGMLYAGVDYGVRALTLPDLTLVNSFLINPLDPRGFAYDLEVVPGADQSVVVGSRSRVDNSTWLGVYDSGIQRSNTDFFYATGLSLEFGDDPSLLYCQDYAGGGFRRYTINAQGLSLLDSDPSLLPTYTAMDLAWHAGRIYSSVGKVVDPLTRTVVGTIAGIPTGSQICYDDTSARVFYLCPGVNQAELRAYDGPTLLPVGTRNIPGVSGSLGRFVRWGLDGFAFATSSGQLILFRSSLIATNPPADLAVVLAQSAPPNVSGSNLTATIVITNAGPNPASQVIWTNTLPTGATVVNASASVGTLAIASNIVSGQLPVIAAGDAATVSVTYKVNSVGVFTNQVFALSSAVDPAFANNVATRLLWIQSPTGLPPALLLSLPLKDLERDPVRPLLYASFGSGAGALADSIVTIDPSSGDIGTPVRVGSDPGVMAASPDGQFLYVALDGAGTVQKLALPGLTSVSSFAVPQNQTVLRMAVSPTDPNVVVIRRTPGGMTSLHVNGVQRPGELANQDLFAFSGTNGALFGCDGPHSNAKLYRLNTGLDGLTLLESQPGKQSSATDLKSSGGLLFFNRGMVVDPDTMRVRAVMPVPWNSVVEPDVSCGRVFYATQSGSVWTLRAFDIVQGIEVGAVPLPGLGSAPRRLLRWGADGLALCTTNSQLVIFRGLLVPTNPPVDVVLQQSVNMLTAATNDILSFTLQLTNHGPMAASDVVVTQVFSLSVTNLSLTTTNGSAVFTNGITTWRVGDLATGSVAVLNVSLRALQTGTLNASAAAYHTLNDSFWGNNTALNTVNILNPSTSNEIQIGLPTRDLAYDPLRDVIYASTPASVPLAGNLIEVINPATGQSVRSLPAGSEPDQLALSDNGHFLHVALDGAMGVQRFDLQLNRADLSFGFGTNDIFFAEDLKAQPGHPETVAASLGSVNFASPFPSDVVIYDNGVARTIKGGPSRELEFSPDGSQLFGYVPSGLGYGLLRMPIAASGVLTNELFTSIHPDPGELKQAGGSLYTSSGQVIEPNIPMSLGSIPTAGPLAVDQGLGRVFYLAQNGSSWELRAFELVSLLPKGTQVVANVQGTPGSLIRCGNDRLAFRTSANQLFIVQSALASVAPLPSADLAVSQAATQDFAAPTETLRFVITVTNNGPAAANNVLLTIKPPSSVASVSLALPQGTSTNASGNFLCNLGTVVANQSLQVTLEATITNTANYANLVSVSATSPDPDQSDNTSLATLDGLFFQRPDTAKIYSASTRTLAYDPVGRRLFAALTTAGTTNQIGWFDPETGALRGTVTADISPTSMRVTDDGQYLYLSATGTGLVQRLHLPTLTFDLAFTPAQASTIAALAVLPGNPHTVALTYWSSNTPMTALFDDDVVRSNQVVGYPFTALASSSDGSTLYGLASTGTGGNSPDVFRLSLDPTGLQYVDAGPSDIPGHVSQMIYSSSRLFFENGRVLNPAGWVVEPSFPIGGPGLAIIPQLDQAVFLTGDAVSYYVAHVYFFAITGRQQLAQIDLRLNSMGFGNLTYCGADRLAFRSSSEIVFVRSSVMPSADLILRASANTNEVMVGDTVNLQLTVSNAGPYAVSGVSLTNYLPAGFRLVSFIASQGAVSTNGQSIVAEFGSLGTNTTALLTLTVSPTDQAVGNVTNFAEVSDLSIPDAILFNNRATLSMVVLPKDSDYDGMPDDWELAHGLNPNNAADAALDSDCDGQSNLQEYQAGTDPFQFDNLRLSDPQFDLQGRFELSIHAAIGKTYTLEMSTNLYQWLPVSTFVCREGDQKVQTPLTRTNSGAFFRLRTDTNAPVPLLTLLDGSSLGTNLPVLQIIAPPGQWYSLQASTNLWDWIEITNYFGVSCTTLIADPNWIGQDNRFYRVLSQ